MTFRHRLVSLRMLFLYDLDHHFQGQTFHAAEHSQSSGAADKNFPTGKFFSTPTIPVAFSFPSKILRCSTTQGDLLIYLNCFALLLVHLNVRILLNNFTSATVYDYCKFMFCQNVSVNVKLFLLPVQLIH